MGSSGNVPEISNEYTVTGRGCRSTSMPSRASSCSRFPSTCTALTIGGICMIAPVSCSAAIIRAWSTVAVDMSKVPVTTPLASSVDVDVPKTISAVYVLPSAVRKRSRRVALPTPTSSTPVASGSSVPAWPTWRSSKRLRNIPTTSWLVTPAGLSTTARPWVVGGLRRAIAVGVILEVSGLRRAFRHRRVVVQYSLDALGGPNGFVRFERQDRRLLGAHLATDERLQSHSMTGQRRQDLCVAILTEQRVEVDDGAIHLRVDIDRRDGDQLESFVVDARQCLGDHLAQRFAEPGGAWIAMLRWRRSPSWLGHDNQVLSSSSTSISGNDHTNRLTSSITSVVCRWLLLTAANPS